MQKLSDGDVECLAELEVLEPVVKLYVTSVMGAGATIEDEDGSPVFAAVDNNGKYDELGSWNLAYKLTTLLDLLPAINNTIMAMREQKPEIKIVVMQRGWIMVGYPIYSLDGERCTIHNAHCIRSWGTKNGLGGLIDGPTKDTVLDKYGTVGCHKHSIVYTQDVNQTSWLTTVGLKTGCSDF